MKRPDCSKYDTCSAPLCPLDEETLSYGIWYPDEEICTKHAEPWIKTQKKIAKKAKDIYHYFTLQMLQRNCVIAKNIDGLDPDKPRADQLKKWLKTHPSKRVLTDEERANRMKRLRSVG